MARTIWKFTINIDDETTIRVPRGARMLTCQMQHNSPQIWAEVDPAQPLEDRRVFVFGTGHPMVGIAPMTYVGTVQQMDGALVWHVYAETK